jgi:hypothetical protein
VGVESGDVLAFPGDGSCRGGEVGRLRRNERRAGSGVVGVGAVPVGVLLAAAPGSGK